MSRGLGIGIPRAALVLVCVLAGSSISRPAQAQRVFLDRGVHAAKLWCFPLTTDSLTYVYMPETAKLSEDESGHPQFSFVRYVINTAGDSASASSITEAKGGGVLHFLVELHTPEDDVREAAAALQEVLKNDQVTLRGPMVFEDGHYVLVSSILVGKEEKSKALATGRAPVLEGNRIALSFDLDPPHATLLQKSFEMKTPDVSLTFDMTFGGVTEAYQAELTVDWSEVRKSQAFNTGGTVYYVSADINLAFDELRRTNAIQLKTVGNDPVTEGLLNTVYERLMNLLFKPVEPDRVPKDKQGGLADALGAMLSSKGAMSSRKTMGFGAEIGYQLREMHSEGKSVLDFNHRSTVQRHCLISFNLGDFKREHGEDPQYFRTVNLGDPAFQQREIQVGVDGALLPEMARAINSITVTLRKNHANGEQTLRELVLDGSNASTAPGKLRMVYGWNGDHDRLAWLDYEFRTRWSFRGGGVFETPWTKSVAPMIDLFAPYERKSLQLAGDAGALRSHGVRAVVVEVAYPFFGEQRRPQLVVRPDDPIDEKRVEVTLPLGQPEYDVTLTWQMQGSQRLTAKRHESSGLIFVDEFPDRSVAAPVAPSRTAN